MKGKISSKVKHPGFIKYAKNSSWLLIEKITRMFVIFFVGIWLTRYLGPQRFGAFSYAQSFVGIFIAIASLGLDGILVRELLKKSNSSNELMGTVFILKILGATLVVVILYIAIQFTSNDATTNTLILIIGSASFLHSFNIIDFYFQSKVLSKYTVYARIITLTITTMIKVFLIINSARLIDFAYLVVLESLLLILIYIYFYKKSCKSNNLIDWTFKWHTAKLLLKDSWPLIFSFLAIAVYVKVDQIMLKEMLGSKQVGQYAAAARLSEAWYFIPTVIATSIFPAIINAKKTSKHLYFSRLQKLYDLMVWSAIAIALPMTFLSDWLVSVLYGDQFKESSQVLIIHIWSGVFVFLGIAFGQYLIAENQTQKALYRTVIGAISNIVLNYILIPIYGIEGAAISTLLSQFITNYLYDFFDIDLHTQAKMKTMSFFPIHYLKLRSN